MWCIWQGVTRTNVVFGFWFTGRLWCLVHCWTSIRRGWGSLRILPQIATGMTVGSETLSKDLRANGYAGRNYVSTTESLFWQNYISIRIIYRIFGIFGCIWLSKANLKYVICSSRRSYSRACPYPLHDKHKLNNTKSAACPEFRSEMQRFADLKNY